MSTSAKCGLAQNSVRLAQCNPNINEVLVTLEFMGLLWDVFITTGRIEIFYGADSSGIVVGGDEFFLLFLLFRNSDRSVSVIGPENNFLQSSLLHAIYGVEYPWNGETNGRLLNWRTESSKFPHFERGRKNGHKFSFTGNQISRPFPIIYGNVNPPKLFEQLTLEYV